MFAQPSFYKTTGRSWDETDILRNMQVELTTEQQALVQAAVRNGRYRSVEEAIGDALSQWERDERRRAELLDSLDVAESDLESGRFTDHTDATVPQLRQELKNEGREMQAA